MGAIVPPYGPIGHEFKYVVTGAEAVVAGASDFTLTFPNGYSMPSAAFGAKVSPAGMANLVLADVVHADNTTTTIHVRCQGLLTAADVLLVSLRTFS